MTRRMILKGKTRSAHAAVWEPSGRWLAVSSVEGWVGIWRPGEKQPERWLQRPHPLLGVAALPGDRLAVSAAGALSVWDVTTGEVLQERRCAGLGHKLRASACGRWLAAGGDQILLIDAADLSVVSRFPRLGMYAGFDFLPDGRLLYVDPAVRLCQRAPGGAAEHVGPKPLWTICALRGLAGERAALIGAASGGKPMHAHVVDLRDGRILHRLDTPSSYHHDIAVSPSGRRIAVGVDPEPRLALWDLERGDVALPRPHRKRALLHTVTFSPDGQTLLTAGSDGTGRIWELPREEG